MQESPGLKPDRLGARRLFARKKLNISWSMSLSKIFPQILSIVSKETGR